MLCSRVGCEFEPIEDHLIFPQNTKVFISFAFTSWYQETLESEVNKLQAITIARLKQKLLQYCSGLKTG